MDAEIIQEVWHVDANGQVFETNFGEMTSWIGDGSLLRQDMVRKGNLRWIEAGKVPSLIAVFNAKENGQPLPPVITTIKLEPVHLGLSVDTTSSERTKPSEAGPTDANSCQMHPDASAFYSCDTCLNKFCKACPSSYGGTVKICPLCGAMCRPISQSQSTAVIDNRYHNAMHEGFGFTDFGRAIAFPFKFKVSLIFGAVMFAFFSFGQAVVSFGGIFMMFSALICLLLANTLSFGVLANTIENFAQGKLDANFMPSFDDFSIWDDVVHPFFLSIGVYLSSFGPLILVMIVGFFFLMGSAKDEMNAVQADTASLTNPELPYAANAAKQSEVVRELLRKNSDAQAKRVEGIENQTAAADSDAAVAQPAKNDEDLEFEKMDQMIKQQRTAQLESAIGKTPETTANERAESIRRILGMGAVFLLFAGIALIWGFLYFPAACAVAGYTRSFTATLNPTIGIDTIRRLGSTYALILVMGLIFVIASSIVAGFLNAIFAPLTIPKMGNLPATFIGSLFGFYLTVVFSCTLGYALFKKSDRLKLLR